MPGPSSMTEIHTVHARLRPMVIVVPAGVYFAALSIRLISTCSEQNGIERDQRQIRLDKEFGPVLGHQPANAARPMISPMSDGSVNSMAPASSRVMSSRLATKRDRRPPPPRWCATSSSRAFASNRSPYSRSEFAEPRIEASGVFRSWESEVSSAGSDARLRPRRAPRPSRWPAGPARWRRRPDPSAHRAGGAHRR